MYHHRLVISYKGTRYFGWQELNVSEEKPTIEASIDHVLTKICKHQSFTISAASRTDAGVHAQGQVLKITIPLLIESEKILLGMNSLLPNDIRVLQCAPCEAKFNSNKDSKNKEYHYYFCTDTVYNPVLNDIIAHIPSDSKNNPTLDIERMQEACKLFIGEHDFYSFTKRDNTIPSTFRTITRCEILKAESLAFGNDVYCLKIIGKGFLRYMIRYIAGALFEVGKSQLSLSDISEALIHHKEEKLSSRAKSKGLHLIEITY